MVEKKQIGPVNKAGITVNGKVCRPTNYKPEYCDRVVELGAGRLQELEARRHYF